MSMTAFGYICCGRCLGRTKGLEQENAPALTFAIAIDVPLVFGLDRSNRRRLAATQSSPPDVITLIITRSGWSAWLRHAADTPSTVKTLSVAVFGRRCGGRRYWLRIVAE
jgi:hypothetical protein